MQCTSKLCSRCRQFPLKHRTGEQAAKQCQRNGPARLYIGRIMYTAYHPIRRKLPCSCEHHVFALRQHSDQRVRLQIAHHGVTAGIGIGLGFWANGVKLWICHKWPGPRERQFEGWIDDGRLLPQVRRESGSQGQKFFVETAAKHVGEQKHTLVGVVGPCLSNLLRGSRTLCATHRLQIAPLLVRAGRGRCRQQVRILGNRGRKIARACRREWSF